MDLLDFEANDLYFDYQDTEEVERLIKEAGEHYADGSAELSLLQAFLRDPNSFNVLVALNRFYYYQHRLEDALIISERFLALICQRVTELPTEWEQLDMAIVNAIPKEQLTWLRLYLFTLKSIGFIHMRLYRLDLSKSIFEKLVAVDSEDRIGAKALLSLTKARQMEDQGLYPINRMNLV